MRVFQSPWFTITMLLGTCTMLLIGHNRQERRITELEVRVAAIPVQDKTPAPDTKTGSKADGSGADSTERE